MTRADFLARLKKGLVGMPVASAAEILSDYEAHFDDGVAAGRSESDVASALGDPERLARELKAEAGVKRWRQEQTPSAAAGAVFAVLGLGAIDLIILLPILMGVIGALFGCLIAIIALFVSGGVAMVAGPFAGFPGGALAAFLVGLGLMALSVACAALLAVVTKLLIDALVWFARLHYRLLKPALEPQSTTSASGDPA